MAPQDPPFLKIAGGKAAFCYKKKSAYGQYECVVYSRGLIMSLLNRPSSLRETCDVMCFKSVTILPNMFVVQEKKKCTKLPKNPQNPPDLDAKPLGVVWGNFPKTCPFVGQVK